MKFTAPRVIVAARSNDFVVSWDVADQEVSSAAIEQLRNGRWVTVGSVTVDQTAVSAIVQVTPDTVGMTTLRAVVNAVSGPVYSESLRT